MNESEEKPRYMRELERCHTIAGDIHHPDLGGLWTSSFRHAGWFAWWKVKRILKLVYGKEKD